MTGKELARLVLEWAEADDFVASEGGWGREYKGELIDTVWDDLKDAMVAAATEIIHTIKGE